MAKTYLEFKETHDTGKTKVFSVECNDAFLGFVKWYAAWRRYTFFPCDDTLFDSSCLKEITVFIDQLMEDRK
jgi:hypothetical protein